MITTVARWGNSHAIRISKSILKQANLSLHDTLSIDVNNDTITLKKYAKSTYVNGILSSPLKLVKPILSPFNTQNKSSEKEYCPMPSTFSLNISLLSKFE